MPVKAVNANALTVLAETGHEVHVFVNKGFCGHPGVGEEVLGL